MKPTFLILEHEVTSRLPLIRISSLQSVGQRLCDRFSAVRYALAEWKMASFETLSDQQRSQVEALASGGAGPSSFFARPAPLCPMDIFSLNRASAASVTGLVVTYMVVLLQMKLAG